MGAGVRDWKCTCEWQMGHEICTRKSAMNKVRTQDMQNKCSQGVETGQTKTHSHILQQNWLSVATPNLSLKESSLSMSMSATLEFPFRVSKVAWRERSILGRPGLFFFDGRPPTDIFVEVVQTVQFWFRLCGAQIAVGTHLFLGDFIPV